MSMRPSPIEPVPAETARIARAAFRKGNRLMRMRDEILAEYGFIFPIEKTNENFKLNSWYQPRYESLAQIEDQLTDIDRHNLKFLERILGPLEGEGI